ncbi:hypothetical protein GCM10028803_21950 [Larkinella knui]|uniref:Uncharacterized protein n=1 Tax=Larkinella knui TaxID=2025310 RepID=A0A3P1CVG2_9BACT|nr:baseplate J/gp47 family protein [Larkinella knui]RRB17271.1 hypothetical protein EHT87_03025 [Larkinella knui]
MPPIRRNSHPLQRSGVSQTQRLLKALTPDFVRVDERSTADLLLFAKEYGRYLTYYNRADQPSGTWQPFMQWDVSAILATLANTNGIAYRKVVEEAILAKVRNQTPQLSDDLVKQHFFQLFAFLFTLTQRLDDQYRQLPTDLVFREYLGGVITGSLQEPFKKLKAYYDWCQHDTLLLPGLALATSLELLNPEAALGQLSPIWTDGADAVVPVLVGTGVEKLRNLASHTLFVAQINSFFRTLAQVSVQAGRSLEMTLDQWPTHTPHYALFLTFLKLFRYSQAQLNTFTARHLDFYYNQVLRLPHRPAQPDAVYLTFELAKQVETHVLNRHTVFKAGKNADGQELFYRTTSDVVLNQAVIKELKAVYVDNTPTEKAVYASPIANSADGKGGKLLPGQAWPTFGNTSRDRAEIGFAVASSQLYCQGGERALTIQFSDNAGLIDIDFGLFDILLTTDKGWWSVPSAKIIQGRSYTGGVILKLDGNDPAIVSFNAKLHNGTFKTAFPIARFVCKEPMQPQSLFGLRFTTIVIYANVTGLKKFSLSNDFGPLDAAKPFQPFGGIPKVGAGFVVGSQELFQKSSNMDIGGAYLTNEWDLSDQPELKTEFIKVSYLNGGQWVKHPVEGERKSKGNPIEFRNPFPIEPDFSADTPLTTTANRGFVRFETTDDFGHGTYPQQLVAAALANPAHLPAAPYVPTIKSLSLNYIFAKTYDFSTATDGAECQFFHLTPFGTSRPKPAPTVSLMPQFSDEGELYIGIENLRPAQSLLVQLAEGSADPALNRTEVAWSFLTNEGWQPFARPDLYDGTDDLTHSGLVQCVVRETATTESTLLPAGLHWLKISVPQRRGAVCQVVGIHPQAVRAVLSDHLNQNVVYQQPVPAKTIGKAVISDPALKKIDQPYDSFGGRAVESDDRYSARVSERLRHKQRGITIWDYERLVLEQFPGIYKVKCLNHSRIDSDVAPGYVLLVPLRDTRRQAAADPFRPVVDLATLDAIRTYLKRFVSAHTRLDVKNAVYEQVKFTFNVKFFDDPLIDPDVYRKKLDQSLRQFLAPWAYDVGRDIEFGGKITKSVVLNFVEEQPYVDYLSCFRMDHYVENVLYQPDVEDAEATTARSVLTSFGNGDLGHTVNILTTDSEPCDC